MTVPPTLERIDIGWLDDVLDDMLGDASGAQARVVSVDVEALPFTGATTDMARLRIGYDTDGLPGPSSLIAKIRGRDDLRVQMDAAMGLFEREVRFYRDLADRVGLRVPRAYFLGDGDERPLLLEDLEALRLGDQSQGLSVADAEAVIDALAVMHAAFWDRPELGDEWLARPNEGAFRAMVAHLMTTGAPALVEQYADRAPDGVLDRVPRDAERWEAMLARMGDGPHTLVHNDCRLDNIFFADDGAPVFVDWQLPADARGTQDVGNLLAGSMSQEDLGEHWEPLLRRYHDSLIDGGVKGYSFDECVLHYRQNVVWALGQGMSLIGAVGAGDPRGVGDKIVMRALSHIADLDSFAALEER